MLIPLLFLLLVGAGAFGDVIFVEDGTVYIGKVATADKNGVTLETFGRTVVIASGSIIRTEMDKEKIQAIPVEVVLKDGSLFRGRITDYDPDIGLLLDMEFGTLTIPVENLISIVEPQQRNHYKGYPVLTALTGEYYFPVGAFADRFGGGFSLSLYAELNTQLIRGLSAGLEATQFFMNYLPSTEISYFATTLTISPIYRLLFLRTTSIPFVKDLVPWASVGGGLAYVQIFDRRVGAYQSSYGGISAAWCASLGLDYFLWEQFLIRLSGRWLAIQQDTALLQMPAVRLGAAFNF